MSEQIKRRGFLGALAGLAGVTCGLAAVPKEVAPAIVTVPLRLSTETGQMIAVVNGEDCVLPVTFSRFDKRECVSETITLNPDGLTRLSLPKIDIVYN